MFLFIFHFLLNSYLFASNPWQATSIQVYKSEKRMDLLLQDKVMSSYRIAMGSNWNQGHKQMEGDERTPEGTYMISHKNSNSRFYLSLKISYPNEQDRKDAHRRGVSPGGDIMIHGMPNNMPSWIANNIGFHYLFNWTDGCIGVTNEEIQEIWKHVSTGTVIRISP